MGTPTAASHSQPVEIRYGSISAEPSSIADRLSLATDANGVAAILHQVLSRPDDLHVLGQALKGRAEFLAREAPEREVSALVPVHRGMFGHKTTIRASLFAEPLTFRGSDLFGSEFLGTSLRQFCSEAPTAEVVRSAFGNVALYAQGTYFGSFRSQEVQPDERRDFLSNHKGPVDLDELRGKQFVQCAERAPAYANVMSVLGFDVLTVISSCTLHDRPEMHAFNIIASRGRFLIADPTNPVVWRYEDGRRSFSIAAYEIPRERIDRFIDGQEIPVTHRDMKETAPGKFEASNPELRVYRGPCSEKNTTSTFFASGHHTTVGSQ